MELSCLTIKPDVRHPLFLALLLIVFNTFISHESRFILGCFSWYDGSLGILIYEQSVNESITKKNNV